jgi:hypothetical protein
MGTSYQNPNFRLRARFKGKIGWTVKNSTPDFPAKMRTPSIIARYASLASLSLALMAVPVPARAQAIATPPTWGGDLLSRPRATGDWFGLRDELGKKGIVFDVDLLLTPQGVATGGRSSVAEFWGNADYTLNVDTGKLGLWPGGFLHVWAHSGFGHNVSRIPVPSCLLTPRG